MDAAEVRALLGASLTIGQLLARWGYKVRDDIVVPLITRELEAAGLTTQPSFARGPASTLLRIVPLPGPGTTGADAGKLDAGGLDARGLDADEPDTDADEPDTEDEPAVLAVPRADAAAATGPAIRDPVTSGPGAGAGQRGGAGRGADRGSGAGPTPGEPRPRPEPGPGPGPGSSPRPRPPSVNVAGPPGQSGPPGSPG
ncbi:hypothetical protein I6A84_12435, partial [Frankia sp. CNm7]|nr:hypothetical protein [Frankia nepalensis]